MTSPAWHHAATLGDKVADHIGGDVRAFAFLG